MRKSCTHLLYCRKRELIALTAHYVNVALCGCGISGIVRVRHYANELQMCSTDLWLDLHVRARYLTIWVNMSGLRPFVMVRCYDEAL